MENRKKTLMITGASGFIGTSFIEKYREKYNIVSVDLLKIKPEEIEFKNVDTILHLAALVHQMNGAPREKYFEVNTELTRKIAEAALKIKIIKLPMIQSFFWILTKIKLNIMVRLYGSLQFDNRETREKLKYIPQINYEVGIENMLGDS